MLNLLQSSLQHLLSGDFVLMLQKQPRQCCGCISFQLLLYRCVALFDFKLTAKAQLYVKCLSLSKGYTSTQRSEIMWPKNYFVLKLQQTSDFFANILLCTPIQMIKNHLPKKLVKYLQKQSCNDVVHFLQFLGSNCCTAKDIP